MSLFVKISPDLGRDEIQSVAKVSLANGVDGIVAVNTSVDPGLRDEISASLAGGLSGEPLRSRALEMDVDYALVVSEDKQISKVYDSRMVPTTFLIDEQGRVTRKFVGFKDEATLDEAIAALVRS